MLLLSLRFLFPFFSNPSLSLFLFSLPSSVPLFPSYIYLLPFSLSMPHLTSLSSASPQRRHLPSASLSLLLLLPISSSLSSTPPLFPGSRYRSHILPLPSVFAPSPHSLHVSLHSYRIFPALPCLETLPIMPLLYLPRGKSRANHLCLAMSEYLRWTTVPERPLKRWTAVSRPSIHFGLLFTCPSPPCLFSLLEPSVNSL